MASRPWRSAKGRAGIPPRAGSHRPPARGSLRDPGLALRLRTANGSVPSPPPLGLRRPVAQPRATSQGDRIRCGRGSEEDGGAGPIRSPACLSCLGTSAVPGVRDPKPPETASACHNRRLGRVPREADANSHSQALVSCQEQRVNKYHAGSPTERVRGVPAPEWGFLSPPPCGEGWGWCGWVSALECEAL